MKAPRYKSYGLLISLPQSDRPWQDIAMDFITGLPPAGRRDKVYDAILVVINRFSKMAQFIAYTKNIDVSKLIKQLNEKIVSKFGISTSIVKDRENLFTFKYWIIFYYYLNIKKKFSAAFHFKLTA